MYFYVPNYLEDDFNDSLSVNGKSCIINYNSSTPTNAVINIINNNQGSSNVGLNDGTYQIEFSKSLDIKKGDYLTDNNGRVFLINWNPDENINCKKSQIQLCTINIDFKRFQNEVIDSDGNSCTPCSYVNIAANTYCYFSRNSGGLYDSNSGDVGIIPNQKISIAVQYNNVTCNLQISDEFVIYNKQFVITDIDYSQLNISGDDGILILYAQILEGGSRA